MTAQQLKNSILQLAVQGKLVPQDPTDEPASVLLERIRAEKEKLIKEGKIKKEKNPSVIFRGADNTPYEKIGNAEPVSIADEVPFDIPDSWEWCRVGDLFGNASGLSFKKEVLSVKTDNMVRVLRGGNIGEEEYYFKDDDVFISSEYVKDNLFLKKNYMITPAVSSLDHIGKIALIEKDYSDVVVGGFVLMLIPVFSDDIISKYLLYTFSAKYHRDNCRSITHKSGQAFYNLSRELLMNLPVPIPPRDEMARIVIQLEKTLPFISEYDEIYSEVKSLNKIFPEQLKKSILQMAVQGKLVPQDENDEPASVLLERIRAEKQRLIAEGKIKKDKNESVIFRRDNSHYEKLNGVERCIDDEIPFDIPDNWCWCRLGAIASVLGGKRIPAGRKLTTENTGYVYIRVSDMKDGWVSTADLQYVPKDVYPSISKYIINKEDVFITVAGTIGRVGKIPLELNGANLTENADRLVFSFIDQDWLIKELQSTLIQTQITDATTKVGQPKLAIARIEKLLIALPPLAEQSRIVSIYESILPLIEQL